MTDTTSAQATERRGLAENHKEKHPGSGGTRWVEAYALLGLWGIITLIFWWHLGGIFMQPGTFRTIFGGNQQPLLFLGLALVVTFSVGEFDLSVASVLGLSAMLTTNLHVGHGWSTWTAVAFALLAALFVGSVNAFLIVILGIDGIVTTLGMSTLLTGVALSLTNSSAQVGLSKEFQSISNFEILSLPLSFYYGAILAGIVAYVLAWTALGRHMTFIGLNREVARLAGVRVQRIRCGAFLTSAFISAIAGVIAASTVGGFDPTTSGSYLLPAFAAVFLGTVVIVPGTFNALGTWVAIYFLATGIIGLQLMGIANWISQVFFGGALILAVGMSRLVRATMVSGVRRR